jgi:hypothetical protein
MTKHIAKLTLVVLALVLSLAGMVNLRSANAGLCDVDCNCNGGELLCCSRSGITCYYNDGSCE